MIVCCVALFRVRFAAHHVPKSESLPVGRQVRKSESPEEYSCYWSHSFRLADFLFSCLYSVRNDLLHSVRNDVTGLAVAALMVCSIINKAVINPSANTDMTNGIAVISIR